MSKPVLPFSARDISGVARSLKEQLVASAHPPGHVELLNMLARSVGCRNFQHFRSQAVARSRPDIPIPSDLPVEPPAEPVDLARVKRLMRYFDHEGRMRHWPSKASHQEACLWVLWSKLPHKHVFTESQINQWLRSHHPAGDHALLRRWLCDYDMMKRTPDGREYRRVERRPPAEARVLIHSVHRRSGSPTPPSFLSQDGRPRQGL